MEPTFSSFDLSYLVRSTMVDSSPKSNKELKVTWCTCALVPSCCEFLCGFLRKFFDDDRKLVAQSFVTLLLLQLGLWFLS